MEFPISVTGKRTITDMCMIYTKNKNTKPVIFTFEFYGEYCTACMNLSGYEQKSFYTNEAPTEIHESFEEQIEDNVEFIAEQYKKFIEEEDNDE